MKTLQSSVDTSADADSASSAPKQVTSATHDATYATPTAEPTTATECQRQREKAQAGGGSSLIKGAYVPECTPTGDFQPLQCEPDGTQCFCVSPVDGIEMKNSRAINLKPSDPRPDCERINSAPAPRTNECTGQADVGPCVNTIERWYYNEAEQKCQSFNYSGCGGNGNNYASELGWVGGRGFKNCEGWWLFNLKIPSKDFLKPTPSPSAHQQCQRRCAPINLDEAKLCGPGADPPYRSPQSGQLVDCGKTDCPSGYRCQLLPKQAVCCRDTESNKPAGALTVSSAICNQPKERGPCDKFELRFYYNKELGECKYFFWGGCEGNENNFERVEDCEKKCGQPKKTTASSTTTTTTTAEITTTTPEETTTRVQPTLPSIQTTRPSTTTVSLPSNRCLHPKDTGSCGAQFIRWYWNHEAKKCETFTYSGCNGNGNNFGSHEECLGICHVAITPVGGVEEGGGWFLKFGGGRGIL